jgi:hypothetical protein
MKVKLASQVFSHSVAAGLETHAALLGSTCTDTAEFVKKFDNLFDAVNSSQLKCQKPLKCAVTEHSDHMSFFQTTLEWIGTLCVRDDTGKDITNNIKCIKGWQISISAIMQLWTDLRNDHGFDFLLTRRLNQDSVENTFSEVRQRGGNNDHPTPNSFRHLFKHVCCSKLLTGSIGRNCETDPSKMLDILNHMSATGRSATSANIATAISNQSPVLSLHLNSDLAMPTFPDEHTEENALYYVCGYLARKIKLWHDCTDCSKLFSCCSYGSKGYYTEMKAYSDNSLITVTDAFYSYIRQLEAAFSAMFDKVKCKDTILIQTVEALVTIKPPTTCSTFPLIKFVSLFARMRIYYKIKAHNETLQASKKPKANNKLKKLKH